MAAMDDNMELSPAKEGRINIRSKVNGLVAVDSARLAAINRIKDVLFTVVPDRYPVKAGRYRRGHEDRPPLYFGKPAAGGGGRGKKGDHQDPPVCAHVGRSRGDGDGSGHREDTGRLGAGRGKAGGIRPRANGKEGRQGRRRPDQGRDPGADRRRQPDHRDHKRPLRRSRRFDKGRRRGNGGAGHLLRRARISRRDVPGGPAEGALYPRRARLCLLQHPHHARHPAAEDHGGRASDRGSVRKLALGGLCLHCDVCRYPNCFFGKGR